MGALGGGSGQQAWLCFSAQGRVAAREAAVGKSAPGVAAARPGRVQTPRLPSASPLPSGYRRKRRV